MYLNLDYYHLQYYLLQFYIGTPVLLKKENQKGRNLVTELSHISSLFQIPLGSHCLIACMSDSGIKDYVFTPLCTPYPDWYTWKTTTRAVDLVTTPETAIEPMER